MSESDLKNKSSKALGWDMLGNFAGQGIAFVISILLARILEPAEFGLIGMALVFITLSQVFVDVGFTSALIQRKDVSKLAFSSVFYINLVLGIVFYGIIYFSSGYIGEFYDNDQIAHIVKLLGLVIIIGSFGSVPAAILQRNLNFKALTIQKLIGNLIGGITGIILAMKGYGVYSLIIQQLLARTIITIILWFSTKWKPTINFSYNEVRTLTGFSLFIFIDRLVRTFFNKIDTLFIGKVFSPAILGFYSRAESLNHQITIYSASSLRKVFFPIFSKVQADNDRFTAIYYKAISFSAFISFTLCGALYFIAEPLIINLLGEKWRFSIIIFEILIFRATVTPMNNIMINAYLGAGFAKQNFYRGLIPKLIKLTPLVVGYFYGIINFTIAVSIASYLVIIYNILYLNKYFGFKIKNNLIKTFEGGFLFFGFYIIIALGLFKVDPWVLSLIFVISNILYSYFIKMEGYLFLQQELSNRYLKITKK